MTQAIRSRAPNAHAAASVLARLAAASLLATLAACDLEGGRARSTSNDAGAPGEPNRYATEARARTVLFAWRDVQNEGDVPALGSFYAPGAAALEERKRLLSEKVNVVVDQPVFKWEGNALTVSFTERRKTPSHAEHGVRSIAFDDHLLITREEPLLPSPGWEDEQLVVTDGTTLKSPVTARLVWLGGRLLLRLTGQAGPAGPDGAKIEVPLHMDPRKQSQAVLPADAGLFDAELTGQTAFDRYRIVREGDAIVVRHRVEPGQRAGIVEVEVVRVTLAPGASVVAR